MAQFGFAAACGFEPSSCEAVCMQVQMEALVMEGSDSSLVPLPEFKPNRCAGQLPSLRVLRARKVAREAACQSERDISNTRMLKTDDVGRHKFICVGPVRTNGPPQISGMKKQQKIPALCLQVQRPWGFAAASGTPVNHRQEWQASACSFARSMQRLTWENPALVWHTTCRLHRAPCWHLCHRQCHAPVLEGGAVSISRCCTWQPQ